MISPARTFPAVAALAEADDTRDRSTPFVAIDLDILDANVARIQEFFAGRPAKLRPHVKSHKSTAIARRQVAVHGGGVTCSTTAEVAAMSKAGITDILLANVVTDRTRLERLCHSAQQARITAAVDSLEAVALLAECARNSGAHLFSVIDCDIGMSRNGVHDLAEALQVAEAIDGVPELTLAGVMAYEGHLVANEDRAVRAQRSVASFEPAIEILEALQRRWDVHMLTGGSTATYDSTGAMPQMTDVQAGTYALMDNIYIRLAPEFEPAMAVIVTVATVRRDGTIVLNVGHKRLGTDWGSPALAGFDAEHRYTAEEHTVMTLRSGLPPAVGDRVALIPPHVCTTMARYSEAFGCRDGRVEELMEIDAIDQAEV